MAKTHINIRLRDGVDDELREWYKSLPNGDKSYIIRDILKQHIRQERANSSPQQPEQPNRQPSGQDRSINLDSSQVGFEKTGEVETEEVEDKVDSLIDSF